MGAVEGVAACYAVRVFGGRYNIDPDYQLSNLFITTKVLFYDDIFHHAAESLFVEIADDIIGEFFDEVGSSVLVKSFADLGNHATIFPSVPVNCTVMSVLVSGIILLSCFCGPPDAFNVPIAGAECCKPGIHCFLVVRG